MEGLVREGVLQGPESQLGPLGESKRVHGEASQHHPGFLGPCPWPVWPVGGEQSHTMQA